MTALLLFLSQRQPHQNATTEGFHILKLTIWIESDSKFLLGEMGYVPVVRDQIDTGINNRRFNC